MPDNIARKVSAFFESYRLQTVAKGHIIIHAGEAPAGIFYLVNGQVRQYDINYRGDEIVVNIFKDGAFFPMAWAINNTPNAYFFGASTDVKMRVAPAPAILAFIKENPDVLLNLLSRVYRGADGALARMAQLMGGNAYSRLLLELIIACRRFGEKSADGSYFLSLSESELGARSGLSRETISREMQKLKKSGHAKMVQGGIVISDLHALEQKLGSNL